MHPEIHPNYLSILIAAVVSFVFSWIWYGLIFRNFHARISNYPTDTQPDSASMMKSNILHFIGLFLTSYVLFFTTNIWRASVWGVGTDGDWCMYGFYAGFYTWLGFYVPMLLSCVAWENASWKKFGFSFVYQFLNLQIIAMIVSYMFAH